MSSDETVDIKPSRVNIVTAEAGDTADSMAARMRVPDKPLETFLLLNGLEPASGLEQGAHYKVVVD